MKKGNFYAVFGGFGAQNWVNVRTPDIVGKCDGLTVCEVDVENGDLKIVSQSHGVESPSTLVVSHDQKFIYCGNESHDFKTRGFGGGVTSFSFDMKTGQSTVLNDNYAFGSATAYITLDKTGKYLFLANCGSKFYVSRYKEINGKLNPYVIRDEGVVTMFEILPDGRIGECLDRLVLEGTGADPVEHASAHPHSVLIDDQDYIVIPNKGGDNIYVAKLDREERKMKPLNITKANFGSSPRHVAFVPGTDFVLIQEEFGAHLNSFKLNRETGELILISRLDTYIPELDRPKEAFCGMDFNRPWGIDVQVHPNGKWIYANNTQPIVCQFEINRETGELSFINAFDGYLSKMSRGIQIDKYGYFLISTGTLNDKVIVYRINQETGALIFSSDLDLPTPTALRFIYPND